MKPGSPVLILVSKQGCGFCQYFRKLHLPLLMKQLPPGKVNFFILHSSEKKAVPECLLPYASAFPSLLLLPWNEYLKVFEGTKVYNPNPPSFTCKSFGMADGKRTLEIFETHKPVETILEWINFES